MAMGGNDYDPGSQMSGSKRVHRRQQRTGTGQGTYVEVTKHGQRGKNFSLRRRTKGRKLPYY